MKYTHWAKPYINSTLARDERGTEVLIGASLTGIVIRQGTNTQFFKWNDITNLVNHKRYFGIECQNYERSVQFILDEPDSAKYVWKMCKFFIPYTIHIICKALFRKPCTIKS